jgi:hypothetical protein
MTQEKARFEVTVSKQGVRFSIDHQAFWLNIEDADDQPKMERYNWYAKQLQIALTRLAGKNSTDNGKAK